MNFFSNFLRRYGLGLLFAANIYGAGSVFILAKGGIAYRYSLLWTLLLSLLAGMVLHELATRLALKNKPIMVLLRNNIGTIPSKLFAVFICAIMSLWAVSNYSATGMSLKLLFNLNINFIFLAIIGGILGISLVLLKKYTKIEMIISILLFGFLISFFAVFISNPPPAYEVLKGFIPTIRNDLNYLAMIISFIGTTLYYPNFWIQSSMKSDKKWEKGKINEIRKDNLFGLTVAVFVSMIVLIVSAHMIPPMDNMSFSDPAKALLPLGGWAYYLFLFGTFLASFTSGTGTLFAAGFILPQAFGYDVKFEDKKFRLAVISCLIFALILIPFINIYTNLNPVDIAILFPAVNGIIFLPITALLLIWFNKKEMSVLMKIASIIIFIILILISVKTANSLLNALMNGIA